MITWFGGIWFVASAVRVNDNTITIRVNEVINIRILGANDNTVNTKSNLTEVETFVGSLSEKNEIKSCIIYRAPFPSIFPIPRVALYLFQINDFLRLLQNQIVTQFLQHLASF